MIKFICTWFLLLFLPTAFASDVSAAYQDGVKTAKSNVQKPVDSIHELKPQDTFKNYTDKPTQSTLYHSVTQGGAQDLTEATSSALAVDDAGKTVEGSFKVRPQYFISPDSYEMQKAGNIISHAANIATGTPGSGIDCKQSQICHVDYVAQECNESTRYITKACTKVPKVTILDQPYQETQHYSGTVSPRDNFSGTFLLPVSGTITAFSAHFDSHNIWRCRGVYTGYLQDSYVSTFHPSCGDEEGLMDYANSNLNVSVTANTPITFSFKGTSFGRWSSSHYDITIRADLHRKVSQVDWVEDCSGQVSGGVCTDTKTECTEAGGTRYFDSVPVSLDCWHYNVTKQCGASSDNNCQSLRDKGCTQRGASCRTMLGDVCAVQNEIYSCPLQKCDSYGIVCNDGSSYCLTGNCLSHQRQPDEDMAKSLSALSAVADASKQFDSKNLSIFTGHDERCSRDNLGFADCCVDNGWGQDIHLASCSDQEKKLGQDKESGVVAYVGEYSIDHLVWTEHKKTYCSFGSKLARIIQVAGRSQLGKSFGAAESPDCRGFTPEELQKINFSKIDFHEFYKDIEGKTHIEPKDGVNTRIADKIDQFYRSKKPHA